MDRQKRPLASHGVGSPKLWGVGRKQVVRRRQGTVPCGGAMHFHFAPRMPGGLDILIGEGIQLPSGETGSMPRQRTHYNTSTYALPEDFPQRLERFQKESGLSWSEIARRIGNIVRSVHHQQPDQRICSFNSQLRVRSASPPVRLLPMERQEPGRVLDNPHQHNTDRTRLRPLWPRRPRQRLGRLRHEL